MTQIQIHLHGNLRNDTFNYYSYNQFSEILFSRDLVIKTSLRTMIKVPV